MPAQRPREYLTTGQAARLLRVSPHAVITMFDRGLLTGYRLQTGTARPFRRILAASVEAKMREWGIAAREDDNGAGSER